jgi:hypothetical protein
MAPWLEQAWLARYLDGLLEADEAGWFEAYVLDKPKLLAMIDSDTRLRHAMLGSDVDSVRRAAPSAAANAVERDARRNDDVPNVDEPPLAARRAPRQLASAARWLPLAAALVLGIGVGRVAWRDASQPAVIANPMHVVYDTMRGAPAPPRVEQAGADGDYVLIQVAVPPGSTGVHLHRDGGDDVPLVPDVNGFANFLLRRSQLASSAGARVDYTVDGRGQSRPLSFDELHRER